MCGGEKREKKLKQAEKSAILHGKEAMERIAMKRLETDLDKAFETLRAAILGRDAKRQHILAEWINTWSGYLEYEPKFDASKLRPYKRGMVVHAHFGFNVGSELGGRHYAVVVENNNNPKNPVLVVVPLYSIAHGKSRDTLMPTDVYVGKLFEKRDVESYADPMQIRAISKMRIIKPQRFQDGQICVENAVLDEIDAVIRRKFTKER